VLAIEAAYKQGTADGRSALLAALFEYHDLGYKTGVGDGAVTQHAHAAALLGAIGRIEHWPRENVMVVGELTGGLFIWAVVGDIRRRRKRPRLEQPRQDRP
jgi:hypothetical protein